MPYIHFDNVAFYYRDVWGKRSGDALCRADFRLEQGKVLCLLGPNGSGKSSIIKLLMGFIVPTGGTIIRPKGIRMAYVGDGGRNLYPNMSLRENLQYICSLRGIKQRGGMREELDRLGMMFNLEKTDAPVSSLSRGMRQKASIICALMLPHDYLVADEPTLGLDWHSQMQFESMIRCEKGIGRGVCIATNDTAMAERISDVSVIVPQEVSMEVERRCLS